MIACVDLPSLPLQLLLHDRPRWRGAPIAVVREPGPDARLIHLNGRARRQRLRPGMRVAEARNLASDLHVGIVPEEQVEQALGELTTALQTFSPRVERDPQFQGVIFVDPSGLSRLYGGTKRWADAVHHFLRGRGMRSTVVVGFERYRALAVARQHSGVQVMDDPEQERTLSDATPLDRLEMGADLRQGLTLLGVRTLGDLLALPAGELQSRFGTEASTLHGLFSAHPQLPMQPHPFDEPVRVTFSLDPPDDQIERILFALKGALDELMRGLGVRNEALAALQLELHHEDSRRHPPHKTRIEPARASRDVRSLLELVRLRLGQLELAAPVQDVVLQAEAAAPQNDQLQLATESTARPDPASARRALARLRATWGTHAVTRARTRDAHLPEASFTWEPIDEVHMTRSTETTEDGPPALVRRVLAKPRALPARKPRDPEAGPGLPASEGTLERLYGPYRISGAWWARHVERDYYYAETDAGALLWIYFDRPRQRWFLHGVVD